MIAVIADVSIVRGSAPPSPCQDVSMRRHRGDLHCHCAATEFERAVFAHAAGQRFVSLTGICRQVLSDAALDLHSGAP
jgi:hypothetical protein